MLAIHTFKIHAKCPYKPVWDYYDVEVTTDDEVDVHVIEQAIESVRGLHASQESIATIIKEQLPECCIVEICGRHSANSQTVVRA